MPLLFMDRITRRYVQEYKDWLFVFGDNLAGRGLGGLAKECRGEPNAIGVPTKRAPSKAPEAFFNNTDADYDAWVKAARPAWDRIEAAVLEGKTVVFPKGGLGTGLAELPKRSRRIHLAIESIMQVLQVKATQAQSNSFYKTRVVR
jgi:hypothetical protein